MHSIVQNTGSQCAPAGQSASALQGAGCGPTGTHCAKHSPHGGGSVGSSRRGAANEAPCGVPPAHAVQTSRHSYPGPQSIAAQVFLGTHSPKQTLPQPGANESHIPVQYCWQAKPAGHSASDAQPCCGFGMHVPNQPSLHGMQPPDASGAHIAGHSTPEQTSPAGQSASALHFTGGGGSFTHVPKHSAGGAMHPATGARFAMPPAASAMGIGSAHPVAHIDSQWNPAPQSPSAWQFIGGSTQVAAHPTSTHWPAFGSVESGAKHAPVHWVTQTWPAGQAPSPQGSSGFGMQRPIFPSLQARHLPLPSGRHLSAQNTGLHSNAAPHSESASQYWRPKVFLSALPPPTESHPAANPATTIQAHAMTFLLMTPSIVFVPLAPRPRGAPDRQARDMPGREPVGSGTCAIGRPGATGYPDMRDAMTLDRTRDIAGSNGRRINAAGSGST
jgi:hypothetical protein